MGSHQLILDDSDDSFERIGSLPQEFQDEMAVVIRGLREDPYYIPGDDYVTDRDQEKDFWLCQHVKGWFSWKLGWYFEFLESKIESVVVFLERPSDENPYRLLLPTNRN
jgi:hypothetical protein